MLTALLPSKEEPEITFCVEVAPLKSATAPPWAPLPSATLPENSEFETESFCPAPAEYIAPPCEFAHLPLSVAYPTVSALFPANVESATVISEFLAVTAAPAEPVPDAGAFVPDDVLDSNEDPRTASLEPPSA